MDMGTSTVAAPGGADLVRRTRIARLPICDAEGRALAYELVFHAGGEHADDGVAAEQATSQLIASTFGTFGIDVISDGRPVFINFTRAFVTGVIPLPVEPDNVVVEVGEGLVADQELMLGLRSLQEAGYRIAVHGAVAVGGPQAGLLDLADFVVVDVSRYTPHALVGLVDGARDCGATLIATGVPDQPTLARCAELGFELFQGAALHRGSVLEGRALSPIQLVCVRLLNALGDPDVPIKTIEQMVGSDPGLTMRLLRTANSAAHGARSEVTSLHQAIVLLGPRRLRSWVVLTLLEGGTTRGRTEELWNVLTRAYSCQRLAASEADLAYTVGLLSGCADLLSADPAEVAKGSGVGEQARAALLEGAGAAGRALQAVLAHERDDHEAVAATGLAPFEVSRAYLESLSESLTVVHNLTQP